MRAHRSTKAQTNVVVRVTEACYAGYRATRPFPLRIGDAVARFFTGPAFTVPSTTGAEPVALAAWLDGEVQRRQAQGPV